MTTTWGKAEREIGSAADAETETTPSDHSAIDASSLASSSILKPQPILNGFLESEIGSAPVSSLFFFSPPYVLMCLFGILSFVGFIEQGCIHGSVDLEGVVFVEVEI